jgi:hypothetical protein
VLGFDSTDGVVHQYKVHIPSNSNPHLGNKDHEDYNHLFLGKQRDDFYLKRSFADNLRDAAITGAERVGGVLTIPFQLFPIDPEILSPEPAPYGDATWLQNGLYRLVHLTAIISAVIALVNLLPLPKLDGSFLVIALAESVTRRPLLRKEKAMLLAGAFFALYGAIFIANLDNVPRYIDSRAKKLQEFIVKHTSGNEKEGLYEHL